jgi:hypothetical protein
MRSASVRRYGSDLNAIGGRRSRITSGDFISTERSGSCRLARAVDGKRSRCRPFQFSLISSLAAASRYA